MKILVCIKQVPDTTEVKINPVTNNLDREGAPGIMNPFDEAALYAALKLRELAGGTVTLMSMGPKQAEEELKRGLSMGADGAYLLCDRRLGGADTLATGYALAGLAKQIGYDLILCGNEAIDGCTGQVGPCIGEHLGIPAITYVEEVSILEDMLTVVRNTGKQLDTYTVHAPALVCIKKMPTKMPNIHKAAIQPAVEVINADFLDAEKIGSSGSPTKVVSISVNRQTKSYLEVDYRWSCEKRIEYIISGGIEKKSCNLIRKEPKKQAEIVFEQLAAK